MKALLSKLFSGQSLARAEAAQAMREIIGGAAAPEQVAAFLGALRAKRETVDEVVGLATAMREAGLRLPTARDPSALVDTCGTGGDASGTFNISTASAFVVAGGGVAVAKHGNRAISSRCGSSEVLGALGLDCEVEPARMGERLDSTGLAFLFAPIYHPAMKGVAPIRRAIGVRTVFNILGPLTNPAGARRQVLGVFDPALLPLMAEALRELGALEAMVVSGGDGLDELTLAGPTRVAHLRGGAIRQYEVRPEEAGLPPAPASELAGGDAAANARLVEEVLDGKPGPRRDAVLYNAAAAFVVAGAAKDLREGAELARRSIDGGAARAKLDAHRRLR